MKYGRDKTLEEGGRLNQRYIQFHFQDNQPTTVMSSSITINLSETPCKFQFSSFGIISHDVY